MKRETPGQEQEGNQITENPWQDYSGSRVPTRKFCRVENGSTDYGDYSENIHFDSADKCDLVTSVTDEHSEDGQVIHMPVLDLDLPSRLISSTTLGHFHLYIDKPMPWNKYAALIQALATVGILEQSYADFALARGYTAVRKPGVSRSVKRVVS